MARSLIYWPEAADDFAVSSILVQTDPEDPELTPATEGEEGEESDEDSDSTPFQANDHSAFLEEFFPALD